MLRSDLVKAALDLVRVEGNRHWKIAEAFDMGIGSVTLPVYDDHEHLYDLTITIKDIVKKKEPEQTELFN